MQGVRIFFVDENLHLLGQLPPEVLLEHPFRIDDNLFPETAVVSSISGSMRFLFAAGLRQVLRCVHWCLHLLVKLWFVGSS